MLISTQPCQGSLSRRRGPDDPDLSSSLDWRADSETSDQTRNLGNKTKRCQISSIANRGITQQKLSSIGNAKQVTIKLSITRKKYVPGL